MKLYYLNTEIDNTKEHELYSDNNLGFEVIVTYKEDHWRYAKTPKEIFHNCTEVHHLFPKMYEDEDDKIAFESDICCYGNNRNIKDLEKVEIFYEIK